MPLGSHILQAMKVVLALSPISAANTAAATSAWIDVRGFEGDIEIRVQTGALTGSLVWTLTDATDSGGSGAAAITPNEGAFATVAANQVQKRTVRAGGTRGFLQVVGTIVTGPVLVAASFGGHPKYTT